MTTEKKTSPGLADSAGLAQLAEQPVPQDCGRQGRPGVGWRVNAVRMAVVGVSVGLLADEGARASGHAGGRRSLLVLNQCAAR